MDPFSADDRPAPEEQPLRARVPDHVAGGAFSTGVIIMTAQTEFVLDFVQNLGRPHQVVSRVVMPHPVLPQLIDALQRNIELYRQRWGELPMTPTPGGQVRDDGSGGGPAGAAPPQGNPAADAGWGVQYAGLAEDGTAENEPPEAKTEQGDSTKGPESKAGGDTSQGAQASGGQGQTESGGDVGNERAQPGGRSPNHPGAPGAGPAGGQPPVGQSPSGAGQPPVDGSGAARQSDSHLGPGTRQAMAQEVYDDLKIRDEVLSGAYANAVMIGHGPHEFSFDFITNFYPNSAVSARVFLAAGQVPRLLDSLRGTWDQMQRRLGPQGRPPNRPNPPGGPPGSSPGDGGGGFDHPDSSPGSGPY